MVMMSKKASAMVSAKMSAVVYGGPEGSFPSSNERKRTCAVAMSGSARTGATMGGPGQQCAETLGFERKQAD